MTKDLENKLLLLKGSIENLSKSYNEQLKIYPDYVDIFDEVISDFHNSFQLLPPLMENKTLSYFTLYEIIRCYNLVELNLSIDERNSDESFEQDAVWNLVREYANNAFTLVCNDIIKFSDPDPQLPHESFRVAQRESVKNIREIKL